MSNADKIRAQVATLLGEMTDHPADTASPKFQQAVFGLLERVLLDLNRIAQAAEDIADALETKNLGD